MHMYLIQGFVSFTSSLAGKMSSWSKPTVQSDFYKTQQLELESSEVYVFEI